MLIRFNMNDDDIDQGERNQCEACPVARCIARTLKLHNCAIEVFSTSAKFYPRNGTLLATVAMPENVHEFVIEHDDGGNPEAISFDLDIPDEVLRYATLPYV